MSLRNDLLKNASLEYENNIFYEKGIRRSNSFENAYLRLREKENRILSDDVVKKLPETDNTDGRRQEWEMRKSSLTIITDHLKKRGAKSILELGCGNGWLSSNIAKTLTSDVCAVDINEAELLQGARVFGNLQNLCFVYTNIFSATLHPKKFDVVILGSSVQYFSDLAKLFKTIFSLTDMIYIIDSPVYSSSDAAEAAKQRSIKHFSSLGFPEMTEQYFHHTLEDLAKVNYTYLYNPNSIASFIKRKILQMPLSIFPIICITR